MKHYCFRKQQLWHRVKTLNWLFPTPSTFPQHLPARCHSPLQRCSRLVGLGCFSCFPSHLLLFASSCTSVDARPPPGSLPAAGIVFARKRALLPRGNKCQVAALSPPWAASFICSKTNWDQGDRLSGTFFPQKIYAQTSVFQACWLQS